MSVCLFVFWFVLIDFSLRVFGHVSLFLLLCAESHPLPTGMGDPANAHDVRNLANTISSAGVDVNARRARRSGDGNGIVYY